MKSEKELKDILFDLFDKSDDADEISDMLRSLNIEGNITDEEYNDILRHWDDWLDEWERDKSFDAGHHIQKHANYDKNEQIDVERISENEYRLFYEAENYEFVGTYKEVMDELGEHLLLKKF